MKLIFQKGKGEEATGLTEKLLTKYKLSIIINWSLLLQLQKITKYFSY